MNRYNKLLDINNFYKTIVNIITRKQNIQIYEMFMRDGLQSLKKIYTVDKKIFFMNKLLECNIKNIEFGSTTSPTLLPQMDNSFILWNNFKEYKNTKNLTMLITDKNNLTKSLNEGIKSFGLLCSISDSFGEKNLKKNSDNSFIDMMDQLCIIYNNEYYKINNNSNYHIRLYLSCSFGTHKELLDDIYIEKLIKYVKNIYEKIIFYNIDYKNIDIVLCDTYGILNNTILNNVLKKICEIKGIDKYIALHLHTTTNFYEYIDTALFYKIYKFDSSLLNIGGCPFSGKENISNINTLDLVTYLESKNYNTDININLLKNNEKYILEEMNK
jgi:hydroxymethylglutaryl-CoA lyase